MVDVAVALEVSRSRTWVRAAHGTIPDMTDSAGGAVQHWYRGIDPVTRFLLRAIAPGGAGVLALGAVLRAGGLLVTGVALCALGLVAIAGISLSHLPFRDGIGVGDGGVLVRSRSRPDQWVPWSEIEKFEVTSRGGADAISIIRSNAAPLLTGKIYSSPLSRGRNAPTIRAYEIQHALEHERVKAIRAARRSARG